MAETNSLGVPAVASHMELPREVNAKPVLQFIKPGYVYGYKTVAVLESTDDKFIEKLCGCATELTHSVRKKDLADNTRFWARAAVFTPMVKGSVFTWRKAVNDLNTEKANINHISEKIMTFILNNQSKLDILHTQKNGEKVSVKEEYLKDDGNRLLKFFNDGNIRFAKKGS